MPPDRLVPSSPPRTFDDIKVHRQDGMTILSPAKGKPRRRVFYLNSYGMAEAWRLIQAGRYPSQHLWGCVELVRLGYEVAMPEEPDRQSKGFRYRRQDLKHLGFIGEWLGKDGIIYSAHTILFWSPLLRALGLRRNPVVTLTYARDERLRFSRGYDGLLALTPAALDRASTIAPKAKLLHIGWGVDIEFFPSLPYSPEFFVSCGKSRRDFQTLLAATKLEGSPLHLTNKDLPQNLHWPKHVTLFTQLPEGEFEPMPYHSLIHNEYSHATAALIILEEDGGERFAAGFTQLLEAMAVGRPVILTRTGAVPGELDVDKQGCGIFVPPNNPKQLAEAMHFLRANPDRAAEMGKTGREICMRQYGSERFGIRLHEFFNGL
ncbi:glycosyltransferase [Horticoccus sp. 23ND18S-11]|uniref:glycosyltransferase n=1 Tax=Horticoccus sp. 23ND18S-11 TaxID=3391832 RepID=UPI0039C95174